MAKELILFELGITGKRAFPALELFAFGLIALLLALHGALLGDWLVDDAGISLAYARNLWAGNGWVSQPGAEPVEGFSNPLWTALLVPIIAVAGDASPWPIKAVAFLFLCAGVAAATRRDPSRERDLAQRLLPALAVVVCPPLVIWGLSGLENALLFFLVALGVEVAARGTSPGDQSAPARYVLGGTVSALLALTRPEAVLYVVAPALALGLGRAFGSGSWRLRAREVGSWLTGLVVVLGGYLLFRRGYFHDWLPNTYYAKTGVSAAALVDLDRWMELLRGVWGAAAAPLGLVLAAALIYLGGSRRVSPRLAALMAYGVVAAASFLMLPPDWMQESRFGTTFGPLLWWTLIEALYLVVSGARAIPLLRFVPPLLVGAALVSGAPAAFERTAKYARTPDLPLQVVREVFGRGLNSVAAEMAVRNGSVLLPDIGGTLLDSELRVYDLAGLSDRRIAQLLPTEHKVFCGLVFETLRPTFVHLHAYWIDRASLHLDPRWRRDYVWVGSGELLLPPGWRGPVDVAFGDFVRRSELERSGRTLDELRRLYRAHGAHLLGQIKRFETADQARGRGQARL